MIVKSIIVRFITVKLTTVRNYDGQICKGKKSQLLNLQLLIIMIVKSAIINNYDGYICNCQ